LSKFGLAEKTSFLLPRFNAFLNTVTEKQKTAFGGSDCMLSKNAQLIQAT
jgi:hypothetical protein